MQSQAYLKLQMFKKKKESQVFVCQRKREPYHDENQLELQSDFIAVTYTAGSRGANSVSWLDAHHSSRSPSATLSALSTFCLLSTNMPAIRCSTGVGTGTGSQV
jgi:hypothetical protein